MTLPEIALPKIELPFDIPVLIHPMVDHFAIVLPIVILLLEFYNLFAKRKSIGGFSFLLIILMIVVFAVAYLTGSVDGKETYDLLSPEGQVALKEHKNLGTYLVFASVVVLFFKLLAMTGKSSLKFVFFLVLIGFAAVTLKQGKEGGELVFKYGANVEKVKELDDALFDANDALEDLQAQKKSAEAIAVEEVQTKEENTDINHTEPVKDIESTQTEVKKDLSVEPKIENVNTKKDEVKGEIPFPGERTTETVSEPVKEAFPLNVEQPKIETH